MRVALVTGSYKGLGFEWCRQLSEKGYQVILTARDFQQAKQAAALLNTQHENVFPRALEVSDENQIKATAEWVADKFGHVDLIVNNAGVNPKDFKDKARMAKAFYLNELDATQMFEVLHVNSIAPLLMVKHFRSLLNNSEHPLVINISSWLGSVSNLSFGGHYGYVGSKNLLNVLNKSMALEIKNDGIISVNVNPGWVQTDMGGQKAQFTPAQAVHQLITNVVEKVNINDTGKFLNYDGQEHAW